MVEAILARHPILRGLERSRSDWAVLQFEEAEAMSAAVLDLCRDYDTVALPVHDSLIVPRHKEGAAVHALSTAFEERFGFTPLLKAERWDDGRVVTVPISRDDFALGRNPWCSI